MRLIVALILVGLLGPACGRSRTLTPDDPRLGEHVPPRAILVDGCAAETARTLDTFRAALAEGWRSYEPLCQLVGPPDWETGSGQLILGYELEDGSLVTLRYAGTELMGAQWQGDGEAIDLLEGEPNG